jgi:hypothetical protein
VVAKSGRVNCDVLAMIRELGCTGSGCSAGGCCWRTAGCAGGEVKATLFPRRLRPSVAGSGYTQLAPTLLQSPQDGSRPSHLFCDERVDQLSPSKEERKRTARTALPLKRLRTLRRLHRSQAKVTFLRTFKLPSPSFDPGERERIRR